ncbi:hypothetical protein GW17_00039002 [Ensete ventricosum]|nr:hypothetical protein GW17_00039002 [Ensete ventricosum]
MLGHLCGHRVLRLSSVWRVDDGGRPVQLRSRHGFARRQYPQRRGPPELRPAPGAGVPPAVLLATDQHRRAPLAPSDRPRIRHLPLRAPHGVVAGAHLYGLHPFPEHMDLVPILWVDDRGLHLAHLPGRHRSEVKMILIHLNCCFWGLRCVLMKPVPVAGTWKGYRREGTKY